MTKTQAFQYLSKIADDEPVFILRAQDRCAPHAVRDWTIRYRQYAPSARQGKINEAVECALAMDAFPEDRKKWPD